METTNLEPVPVDQCSLVKTIELLGDKWILLIMRHVFYGRTHFDQFVEELSISRSVLSERLKRLTEYGIVQKVPYKAASQRTRHTYELTAQGLRLFPALIALMQWGDRYLSDQAPLQFSHKDCGAALHVGFVCEAGHVVHDYRDIKVTKSPDFER